MKFYGAIGFRTEDVETAPGVFKETIVERPYYGDFMRNTRNLDQGSKINGDIDINNTISIVADPYALGNFHQIRYVKYLDSKWIIKSIELQYPRLVLQVGGLYHGG